MHPPNAYATRPKRPFRLGHCGFKAVLDEHNRQVLSSKDKPRRELVWLKTPTKSYLRARETLTNLHERRSTLRHDFRHRVTTEIVRLAQGQSKDLIAVEDLQISSMNSSARGTSPKPGRNVRAKSGLNRSILRQGWARSSPCSPTRPARPELGSSQSGQRAPPRPAATAGPWTPIPGGTKTTLHAPPAATKKTPTSTPAGSSPGEEWQSSGK